MGRVIRCMACPISRLCGQVPGVWSVKPRLRLVPGTGLLVLTGGRPGIFLWVSPDGGDSWEQHNIAAMHNAKLAAGGGDPSLNYSAAVVDVKGPHDPRADPPETSSYTALGIASDGAVLVAYDRLAAGWPGGPGRWGPCDTAFTMRVHLAKASRMAQ